MIQQFQDPYSQMVVMNKLDLLQSLIIKLLMTVPSKCKLVERGLPPKTRCEFKGDNMSRCKTSLFGVEILQTSKEIM